MIKTSIKGTLIDVTKLKRGSAFVLPEDLNEPTFPKIYRITTKTVRAGDDFVTVEAICINDGNDLSIGPGEMVISGEIEGELIFTPKFPE
jgi:hypothetical protein